MKSKKKKFGGCRDIISDLPDSLICHILSFLPTKEAASTSVLAKRWKPLLAFVPNLDFDDSIYLHPPMTYEQRRTNARSFMRFVDSVLALQGNARINRFHLMGKHISDELWVLEWIPNVLKRGVSDIYLNVSSFWESFESKFYPLPQEIFVSKTLVRLKIQFDDGVNIDVEGDVSLPKLKTLHLDYFKIKTSTFNKLLCGCYALEELVLINLIWDEPSEPEPCCVTVSLPTLKRLNFCRFDRFDEGNKNVSMSFNNPNLVNIEYFDSIADSYLQVSFDSLVEVRLGLRLTTDQDFNQWFENEHYLFPKEKSNVTNLLTGLRHVKTLYLSDESLQVLGCCRDTIPVFDNLIELTVETKPDVIWKPLPAILKSCPNLVTLVFEGLHHIFTDRCEDEDGCLCRYRTGAEMEVVARTCLSSSAVKVLKIVNFGEISDDGDDDDDDDADDEDGGIVHGLKEQIEQVKHFLEKMPNLEQVILEYYYTSNDEEVMKVFNKLQKFRGVASANCKLQLISKNLSLSSNMSD
ncbi:putative F-box/LRR-repeat protein [Cardamine amara subsp. amara]|uniref:F-box/LRR-repeat protein n=1 Tax=Cardamine amara subsp. amara TaxID=228776 RepID=A0ABD1BY27_CARAN